MDMNTTVGLINRSTRLADDGGHNDSTSIIVKMFLTEPDILYGVMDNLNATYCSMIIKIYSLEVPEEKMKLYLNPLRDVPAAKTMHEMMSRFGIGISLVGADTYTLLSRVMDPLKFWESGDPTRKITLWMVMYGYCPDFDGALTIFHDSIRKADAVDSTDCDFYAITHSDVLPYRLVLDDLDGIRTQSNELMRPNGLQFLVSHQDLVEFAPIVYTTTSNVSEDVIFTGVIDIETDQHTVHKVVAVASNATHRNDVCTSVTMSFPTWNERQEVGLDDKKKFLTLSLIPFVRRSLADTDSGLADHLQHALRLS